MDNDCSHEIKTLERQHIKKQRQYFAEKGLYCQSYGFPCSCVEMWDLDHKEGWELKNCCFGIVLEKILESPLDCKEIKPVNHKGNQSCIFTGRTDPEAEAPIFWPPDVKSQLIGKDPDARRRGWQRIRELESITDSVDRSLSKLWWRGTEEPGMLQSTVSQSKTRLSNCTTKYVLGSKFPDY